MAHQPDLERFESSNGASIFRIPLEAFPGYWVYSHLVVNAGKHYLVDVGSGLGSSHAKLLDGLAQIEEAYSISARLDKLDFIIITHGHIDHFGGLASVKDGAPQAKVCIHELARPALVNYDERLWVTSQRMALFLEQAGVPADRRQRLLEMHRLGKQSFKPQPVDMVLADGQMLDDTFSVVHVPGHEPGLIMLKVGDVLLTADHVLPNTSVALSPETIMPFTGVSHYIESLDKAARIEGVRVALGGHEAAMLNYVDVVRRTYALALEKVDRVYEMCATPNTIFAIATQIYGPLDGYGELLKLGQIGARIEYLNQRGLVMIDNWDVLEHEANPILQYRRC